MRQAPGTTFLRFEGEIFEKSSPQKAFHMCRSFGSCGNGPPSCGSSGQFYRFPKRRRGIAGSVEIIAWTAAACDDPLTRQ